MHARRETRVKKEDLKGFHDPVRRSPSHDSLGGLEPKEVKRMIDIGKRRGGDIVRGGVLDR